MSGTRVVTVHIPEQWYELLALLGASAMTGKPEDAATATAAGKERLVYWALLELANHAQQGIARPSAWQRAWLEEPFGVAWQAHLVLDPASGRLRPRKAGDS